MGGGRHQAWREEKRSIYTREMVVKLSKGNENWRGGDGDDARINNDARGEIWMIGIQK